MFEGADQRRFRAIKDATIRKPSQLDAAHALEFLRSPPGNPLEALKHDRVGQQGIRIKRQWRVCFVRTAAGPEKVEIVDQHRESPTER